jgi:GAF domain-containing protein
MELSETSRDIAFCDHVIRAPDQLLEVIDARADARFVDNPLVTGDAKIRFYAGMPLQTPGGAAIGTVCVIDREPRELTAQQREALASLARLTMNLLEGHQREREFERAALLATMTAAEPAPEIAAHIGDGLAVVIFEVQEFASAVARRGERAIDRALADFERAMDPVLRHDAGDSISRVSGSAEVITVLHGAEPITRVERLQACIPEFEGATGLRVISAWAESDVAGEALAQVFLRADEALSREKDARAGQY